MIPSIDSYGIMTAVEINTFCKQLMNMSISTRYVCTSTGTAHQWVGILIGDWSIATTQWLVGKRLAISH